MKIGHDRTSVAVRRRPDGRHDRHGVPPPREAAGRLRSRRHRDGQLRGARPRHRSDARVRRIHRGRAADLDPDLRRRSRRRWPTAAQIVEGMGADIVDVNMGCPVPKIAKHNAGCSLMREPAHAASGDRGDGEGREDSGDGQDARRLERRRAERPDAGADGRGCRRGGGRRARPDRRAELQRLGGLGSGREHRRQPDRFRSSAAATASSRSRSSSGSVAASRACSSAAACCAIRGFSRRPPTWPPAVRLAT